MKPKSSAVMVSYTSQGAILTDLIASPTLISVIDEFGDKLGKATGPRANPMEAAAFDMFKELYSSAHGSFMPRGYSSVKDAKKAEKVEVLKPSFSIVGMTTPRQFTDAIHSGMREGGFLNRFIVVDTSDQMPRLNENILRKIPMHLVEQVRACRERRAPMAPSTIGEPPTPREPEQRHDQEPEVRLVNIPQEVADYYHESTERQLNDYWSDDILLALSNRWHETAMRVTLALAVLSNPQSPKITMELARWCLDYVVYHGRCFAQRYVDEGIEAYTYEEKFQLKNFKYDSRGWL